MIQTKLCGAALAIFTACLSLYAGEQRAQETNKTDLSSAAYGDEMMPQDQCSTLTQEEQTFSEQLSDDNAMVFCSQMTPMQRQKAMQMAGVKGPSGTNKMSPDAAVEQVMGSTKRRGGTGTCPVQ